MCYWPGVKKQIGPKLALESTPGAVHRIFTQHFHNDAYKLGLWLRGDRFYSWLGADLVFHFLKSELLPHHEPTMLCNAGLGSRRPEFK